ncbi:MAG TPA: hypothetical protein VL243_17505 [Vicinamibacterales bacterium]|nr:hypothetical protein [Vicinamibacterales bacterium]
MEHAPWTLNLRRQFDVVQRKVLLGMFFHRRFVHRLSHGFGCGDATQGRAAHRFAPGGRALGRGSLRGSAALSTRGLAGRPLLLLGTRWFFLSRYRFLCSL